MKLKLIFLILLLGVIYRLVLTSDGNFIFNMDNARDMVDVREMVVVGKMRLIGHTAAIEGVFYGPYWYYLSSVPFYLSNGNPYGSILMLILMWALGGYFLLKLMQEYGSAAMIATGMLWVFSNPVVLATFYAYNPNPAILLTPVLIYCMKKFLQNQNLIACISMFVLSGMMFSFEIMYAILLPIIIILSMFFTKNKKLFLSRTFWFGVVAFLVTISPHAIFELKHNFFMTHSLLNYISNPNTDQVIANPIFRISYCLETFLKTIYPVFMNFKTLTWGFLIAVAIVLSTLKFKKKLLKDELLVILLTYILVTVIGFIALPFTINSWHWVGIIPAIILLCGVTIFYLPKIQIIVTAIIVIFSLLNANNYLNDLNRLNPDPALYKNELAVVDRIFGLAEGKNFKVYTYMPSVIDYPYQYLFWWRGLNKYGYIPEDYAYSPNKPEYISQKNLLPKGANPPSSGLIFLLKEPDRNNLRHLWENDFKKYELISSQTEGSYIIEIRRESSSNISI